MKTSDFSTSFIRNSLPLLEECYGFDITEISIELSCIINQHVKNKCTDEELLESCKDERGYINQVAYGLKSDDRMFIPVTDDFEEQFFAIKKLCEQYNQINEQSVLVLLFMAAIFNRNLYALSFNPEVENVKQEVEWNARIVRPDLLRLFIVLNQEKVCDSKGNPKTAIPIKIGYKNQSLVISNKRWWFTHMMKDYLRQKLGDMTVEAAQEELALFYGDEKGRKSNNPYLNYIICGTYNLIKKNFPSDKVTVEQCRFLLQYLKAIRQLKENDKLSNINNLQSHVRELLKSQFTPIQKHIKAKKYKSLPLYQRIILY